MSYMKDGLLLAAGGAIGLIAGVMLCDTLNDEKTTIDGLTEEPDNILRDIAPKNEVCVGG